MALWMTALKLVPWGDVIEATPQILQSARKLMGKTTRAGNNAEPAAATLTSDDGTSSPTSHAVQLAQLRDRVTQLEQEQRDSAALIQSLAEQNAVVIKAVDALRQRNQRLTFATMALGVLGLGLLVGVLAQ